MPVEPTHASSKLHRWVTVGFGCALVAAAAAVAFAVERPYSLGAVMCILGLVLVGGDAVIAAARGRRSLLERIGPLP